MTTATTGDTATMSRGKRIAKASTRTAASRGIATSSDESNTTGSKVIADIDHSATMLTCSGTAASAASRSGAANATKMVRRPGSTGHKVSPIALTLGRAASTLRIIGAAI